MAGDGPLRRLLRAVRRLVLPELDLMLLQRRWLVGCIEPGSRVLDAGCGDGTLALLLARRGCRVTGVSNDAEAIERCRSRAEGVDSLEFVAHDLRDGPPPGSPFDAALCFDVLEHILDDRAALAAVAAGLRPGGSLLVTVPNRAAPPLWGDTVSATEDGGHVRQGYARDELEQMLADAGLRPQRWVGFGGYLAQKATNVSRRLETRGGTVALVVRVAWLVGMRLVTCVDPLLPYPTYEHFVLAKKLETAR